MLIATVFAILALALWCPDTRIGGFFRRLLIDAPVNRLDKLKRGHVLLLLAIVAAFAVAWVIGKEEGVQAAGRATAETIGNTIGIGFDLATWLDVSATTLAIAATVRFGTAIGLAAAQAKQWISRCAGRLAMVLTLARARARRLRRTPRPRRGEDPDRPAPGLVWA